MVRAGTRANGASSALEENVSPWGGSHFTGHICSLSVLKGEPRQQWEKPSQSGCLRAPVCWRALGAGELCPPMFGCSHVFGCSKREKHLGARHGPAGCPVPRQHPSLPTVPLARGLVERGHDVQQEAEGFGRALLGRALLHPGCYSSSFPLPRKGSGSQIRNKQ